MIGGSVSTAVGDVNGDGAPDLVVGRIAFLSGAALTGEVEVYLGDQSGVFGPDPMKLNPSIDGFVPFFVIAGDLNGDGLDDVLAVDSDASDDLLQVWLASP